MQIHLYELLEGAEKARGLTVIIDVFRCFSLECYLFSQGAARILPAGAVEEALSLKERFPDAVLFGERHGRKLPGFLYGNSPSQSREADFTGQTIIHTTSAGTQGITHAVNASEIVTGALVNAKAVADYIRSRDPEEVSIVAMGVFGQKSSEEDVLCAEYIRAHLLSEAEDFPLKERIEALKNVRAGAKFFSEDEQDVYPRDDFFMCTKADIFPFVIRMEREDGLLVAKKILI
jgi:2-phosphosulfolactate phosphatase